MVGILFPLIGETKAALLQEYLGTSEEAQSARGWYHKLPNDNQNNSLGSSVQDQRRGLSIDEHYSEAKTVSKQHLQRREVTRENGNRKIQRGDGKDRLRAADSERVAGPSVDDGIETRHRQSAVV